MCYVSVFKTLRNMEPMISFREIFIPIWTRYNIDWHFVKKILIVGKLFISVDGISFKCFFCGSFSFIQAIWCLNQAASILTIHKRWYTELLINAAESMLLAKLWIILLCITDSKGLSTFLFATESVVSGFKLYLGFWIRY